MTPEWVYSWGRGETSRRSTAEFPAEVVALVTEAQGGKFCQACHEQGLRTPLSEPLELDHKRPLARGGDNGYRNLRWLCRGHNRGRGARTRVTNTPPWARKQRRDGTA